jgi:hypothetical protein
MYAQSWAGLGWAGLCASNAEECGNGIHATFRTYPGSSRTLMYAPSPNGSTQGQQSTCQWQVKADQLLNKLQSIKQ